MQKYIVTFISTLMFVVTFNCILKAICINSQYKRMTENNLSKNMTSVSISENDRIVNLTQTHNNCNITDAMFKTTSEVYIAVCRGNLICVASQIENALKKYTSVEVKEMFDIPIGNTSFHGYMDYQYITDHTSDQYQLQLNCWTDTQGIRKYGNDVCIALGSYYGTKIGTRYLITTDCGNCFTAILADCKSDDHTDYNHQYRNVGMGYINVFEFVVDTSMLDKSVINSGNIGTYTNYTGNIISIQKIGE